MVKKRLQSDWETFDLLKDNPIHLQQFHLADSTSNFTQTSIQPEDQFHLDDESLQDLTRISSSFSQSFPDELSAAVVKKPVESDTFSFFPNWSLEEVEIFFASLKRHSRLNPEMISSDLKSKNLFQVIRVIEDLRKASFKLPPLESDKKRPEAAEASNESLSREAKRAAKHIKREEKQARSKKFTVSTLHESQIDSDQLLCKEQWNLLAKCMMNLDTEVLEDSFALLLQELKQWLRQTFRSLIPIAMERDRTLGKAKNFPTKRIVISNLDVQTHFEASRLLNACLCQHFRQPLLDKKRSFI